MGPPGAAMLFQQLLDDMAHVAQHGRFALDQALLSPPLPRTGVALAGANSLVEHCHRVLALAHRVQGIGHSLTFGADIRLVRVYSDGRQPDVRIDQRGTKAPQRSRQFAGVDIGRQPRRHEWIVGQWQDGLQVGGLILAPDAGGAARATRGGRRIRCLRIVLAGQVAQMLHIGVRQTMQQALVGRRADQRLPALQRRFSHLVHRGWRRGILPFRIVVEGIGHRQPNRRHRLQQTVQRAGRRIAAVPDHLPQMQFEQRHRIAAASPFVEGQLDQARLVRLVGPVQAQLEEPLHQRGGDLRHQIRHGGVRRRPSGSQRCRQPIRVCRQSRRALDERGRAAIDHRVEANERRLQIGCVARVAAAGTLQLSAEHAAQFVQRQRFEIGRRHACGE